VGISNWIHTIIVSCILLGLSVLPVWAQDQQSEDKKQIAASEQQFYKMDSDVAEESVLNETVSLQLEETTLLGGVQKVARKAGLELSYDTQLAVLNKKISLSQTYGTVQELLWKILKGTGLRFAVSAKG